ncbi:hypothetical protein [Micromonospora sp. CA-246542]|uniref:hypothetical protein n=1 Tax=Micromonospora sp. CA-246542 TaxID=3239959 RepID=UPI003D8D3977
MEATRVQGTETISDASYVAQRTKGGDGYIPPTSNAFVRFMEKHQHRQEVSESGEATSGAGVEFSYRDVDRTFRSKMNVPGRFTDSLLEALTVTVGVVGTVAAPVAIAKFASGSLPSELLFALCLAAVVAVGGLVRSVIKRRR